MDPYQDGLHELNKKSTLAEKLNFIHSFLKNRYGFIDRIAVAVYEPKCDMLKTLVHSSADDHPLTHYQAKLGDAGSLQEILRSGNPRVVNDLAVFDRGLHEHTKRIAAKGYGSSYTMPMYLNGSFFGFVFFNSYQKNCFQPELLHYLDLFGHLISLLIVNDLAVIRTMMATVKAARDITYYRDTETGAHLDRISHYSRIIANEMAIKHGLDDEFVEHVFLFSSLHDIGKLGVPDTILKKPEPLSREEFELMKTHARKGREIVDSIIQDFGLSCLSHIEVLKNIAEFHHEALDGSGYPHGKRGDEIPIEARIISVADIFDALTSQRPYKEAWTNEEAFQMLKKLSGIKLDPECVEALVKHREEVEKIQRSFKEALYD